MTPTAEAEVEIVVPPDPVVDLLPPTDDERRMLARARLGGASSSGAWLPADHGVPELDDLARDHARLREAVGRDALALRALRTQWAREDREHETMLAQAARTGGSTPGADGRTPPGMRAEREAVHENRLWPAVLAFAEVVQAIIECVAEHEPAMLARQREEYAQALAKRREAEQMMREADAASWHAAQVGRWVQGTSDAKYRPTSQLGLQPAPDPSTPRPAQVTEGVIEAALERPWHRRSGA